MTINWTTFFLEVINFLVLVWLLKHFLYKPVLDMVDKRRQAVAENVARAERDKHDAESLIQEYDARFQEWENERARAREELAHEVAELRTEQMAKLDEELDRERRKRLDIEQHQTRELMKHCEAEAVSMAALFATKLLTQLASASLCEGLLRLSLQQLNAMSEKIRERMDSSIDSQGPVIHVSSSHLLGDALRKEVESTFHPFVGGKGRFEYSVDPGLIAGVSIRIDSLVLDANLKAELKFFQEFSDAQ